jgi:oligoendopeptidase F
VKKTVKKRLTRSEVPEELTWNLVDLFSSEQVWQAELNMIEKEISKFAKFKGTLHTGPKALFDCLRTQEQLSMRVINMNSVMLDIFI